MARLVRLIDASQTKNGEMIFILPTIMIINVIQAQIFLRAILPRKSFEWPYQRSNDFKYEPYYLALKK